MPGRPASFQEEHGAANFADNLNRLLGLHGLSANFAAQQLGVSSTTMSAWMTGKSIPSLVKAVAIAELFGISAERLIAAPFSDLLSHELADAERFERVETRLKQARRPSQPA